MNDRQPRREFLERLGVSAAGLMAAGHAATAKGFPSNETIRVGAIGTGGRCRQLLGTLGEIPGVKIVGVCDIWDANLARGLELADKNAFTTKDHRALLDRSDIDAVVIGTPDHWHVPITIDACAAGKDVYVEKPLTHDLSEGAAVIAAQNDYKRIVQVGMQQRSMPHLIEANDILRSGKLGQIRKVHLTWNRNTNRAKKKSYGIDPKSVDWKRFLGNAPDQPFDEYRFRHWRWFWDFGGGIFTDLMVHYVDVAHWFLDLDHPAVATSIGDHFMAKDVWQTPDTVQTLLRYPDRELQVYFEGTFVNARNAAMMEYMGTDATLYCDRGRYEIHPERKRKIAYSEKVLGSGSRGADFYDKPNGRLLHLLNWLDCIRSRETPNAPAEAGVSAASAAHLSNIALRRNQVARWNA